MDETSRGGSLPSLANVHVFLCCVDEPSRLLPEDNTHSPPRFLERKVHGSQNVQKNSSSKTNIKGVSREQVSRTLGTRETWVFILGAMVTW